MRTTTPPARDSARRSLSLFNLNLLLRAVFDAMCGPTTFLFVAFVLSIGIPGEAMGRVASVASLACVMQVLILPLARFTASRKRFIIAAGLIEPLVVVAAILLIPMLPARFRIWALMGAVMAAAAFVNMTRPFLDDWLAAGCGASTRPGPWRGWGTARSGSPTSRPSSASCPRPGCARPSSL